MWLNNLMFAGALILLGWAAREHGRHANMGGTRTGTLQYVAAREAASWVLCSNNANVISLSIFLVLHFALRNKYCPDTDISKHDILELGFLEPTEFWHLRNQPLAICSGCTTSQCLCYTFAITYPTQNCTVHALRLVQRSISRVLRSIGDA
jgi:hypothetical protein